MIEVEDLTRYYGTHRALEEVTFTVDERAIVGILGLNGAGKSTLLKILGGLLSPSAGRVEVGGVDAVEAPNSLRGRIGFLPEEPPLYDDMRVDDFLTWCGRIKGTEAGEVEDRLPEVAEICDIREMRDRLIRTLSHGYRKRVGIAQAIIHDPELVILDEPISGLDPVQIVDMRDVLRRLHRERTVLVSSHILSEVAETCDRVLVLHEGRLVADATQEELADKLGGGVRLVLELRGEEETIESVFSRTESVLSWEHGGTVEGVSEFEVRMDPDERERLVDRLVEAGAGLRSLGERQTELEQAFLDVTGESERDPVQSGEGGDPASGPAGADSREAEGDSADRDEAESGGENRGESTNSDRTDVDSSDQRASG